MSDVHRVASLEETAALARKVASTIRPGDVVFLSGDLGAGKTTFVTHLSEALGADPDEVASPTFALVHQYDTDAGTISHLDGYRLSDQLREWQELGVLEIVRESYVTLVEWPRRALETLTPPTLRISIELDQDERIFTFGRT